MKSIATVKSEQFATRSTASRRRRGFTMIELMVVVGTIGMLAGIAVPNYVHARGTARSRICVSNLRTLQDGKDQWALDTKKTEISVPLDTDLAGYLRGGKMPSCPSAGTYNLRRVAHTPTCTYSGEGHTLNALDITLDLSPD